MTFVSNLALVPTPTLAAATPLPAPNMADTRRPTATITPSAAPTRPQSGENVIRVGAAGALPAEMAANARQLAERQPDRFAWVGENEADVTLNLHEGTQVATWVYAVAAPFATVNDGTTLANVQAAWQVGSGPDGVLVVDHETHALWQELWGAAGPGVSVVDSETLTAALWQGRPSLTLIPFHRLTPELKVLRMDGQSPLERGLDVGTYVLAVPVFTEGNPKALAAFLDEWPGPATNRDEGHLTRVAMSGVTALARATAYQMEIGGVTAAGAGVAPVLAAADIAHVSSEVSFAPDCPFPNPIGDPLFCSNDKYLELLQSIGVDVVELTGNHLNDWGTANLVHTLELYDAAGLRYFGGGRDLAEAERPATFDHNGNQIAFVGCNPLGPAYAWATAASPGARPCDYPRFYEQIGALQDEGNVVIATLQYWEFYHYPPTGQQQADFRAVAEAGAAAVSGSQGHHAQGFDFHNGAFIHYGLGNLFFDQMDMLGTRQSFIDVYSIYDGRLLNVELVTSLIENYCCPRPMTAEERTQLLQAAFQASGW